ncbi:MAG: WG repeat-containing protein, partial [Bacteroidota bacterium]
GKLGFDDEKMIIPFEYSRLSEKYSNFMIAKKYNVGVGVIDSLNREIIPFVYREIVLANRKKASVDNKYFLAYLKDKVGVINPKGEVLIPIEYKKITLLKSTEDYFQLERHDKKIGFANLKDKVIKYFDYEGSLKPWNENFIQTINRQVVNKRVNRRYGCINHLGEVIVPAIYKSLEYSLDEKYLLAYDGQDAKVFDKEGNVVFEHKGAKIENLVLGNYKIFQNRKSQLVRNDFKEVIPVDHYIYDVLSPRHYLINKLVISDDPKRRGKRFGLKNHLNQEVLPLQYPAIKMAHENLIFARAEGVPLYAGYDINRKKIIPPTYTQVKTFPINKFTIVQKPNSPKFAVLDSLGNAITPYEYDNISFSATQPDYKNFQIVGVKGKKRFRILPDGSEAELIRLPPPASNYFLESDETATQSLKAKYEKKLAIDEKVLSIQYHFLGNGKGEKIIGIPDEKGDYINYTQPFDFRISNVNQTGETPWLWIFFEELNAEAVPKSELNWLNNNKVLTKEENFQVEVKYPYTNPKVIGLDLRK